MKILMPHRKRGIHMFTVAFFDDNTRRAAEKFFDKFDEEEAVEMI